MNQFTITSIQKRVLFGGMILGLLCLILTFFADGAAENHHARFWTNLLHNSVFFTGIAFISLFVLAAFTTAYAGWYVAFKRVWEAYAQFLVPGFILMLIIAAGVWMHWHHLYHWADESLLDPNNPNYDEILDGKKGFLNKNVYTFGTIIIVGTWIFFAKKLRSLSIAEEAGQGENFAAHRTTRKWSAWFLPIAAFTSAMMIWQWVMSIDAHWYSTMFAWYSTASWFVAACSLTILTLIYLKSQGYYEDISLEHFHDLGKYLFAFSIFWTYLWFSQYMLIWYANVGEETIYFKLRIDKYPVLFYGNLIINFVLPFLILVRNSAKRRYGILIAVCVLVFFGHWWDFFYMIKPGVAEALSHAHGAGDAAHHGSSYMEGFTIPGMLEIGTFIGFLSFFVYFAFNELTKANLDSKEDPYMDESLHHEVEQDLDGHHAH